MKLGRYDCRICQKAISADYDKSKGSMRVLCREIESRDGINRELAFRETAMDELCGKFSRMTDGQILMREIEIE